MFDRFRTELSSPNQPFPTMSGRVSSLKGKISRRKKLPGVKQNSPRARALGAKRRRASLRLKSMRRRAREKIQRDEVRRMRAEKWGKAES